MTPPPEQAVRFETDKSVSFGGKYIYVVDLQEGGNRDWGRGEPPADNPAYDSRFAKAFPAWAERCDISDATTLSSFTTC